MCFTIYFIQHIIGIINFDDFEKKLINKSESYKIGTLSALYLKPIFDLTVLYTVLFRAILLVKKRIIIYRCNNALKNNSILPLI